MTRANGSDSIASGSTVPAAEGNNAQRSGRGRAGQRRTSLSGAALPLRRRPSSWSASAARCRRERCHVGVDRRPSAAVPLASPQNHALLRFPRVVLLILTLSGCVAGASQKQPMHPANLVGSWVRLREDQSWGDTLTLLLSGKVLGSTGHQVPESAHWWVETGSPGAEVFCVADAQEGSCQGFHLVGDDLVVGTSSEATTFRRVRRSVP